MNYLGKMPHSILEQQDGIILLLCWALPCLLGRLPHNILIASIHLWKMTPPCEAYVSLSAQHLHFPNYNRLLLWTQLWQTLSQCVNHNNQARGAEVRIRPSIVMRRHKGKLISWLSCSLELPCRHFFRTFLNRCWSTFLSWCIHESEFPPTPCFTVPLYNKTPQGNWTTTRLQWYQILLSGNQVKIFDINAFIVLLLCTWSD